MENRMVQFVSPVLHQAIGIPMSTNCAPLLAGLFLHGYEAVFLQGLLKKKVRQIAKMFNYSFCYIDDVLVTEQFSIRSLSESYIFK